MPNSTVTGSITDLQVETTSLQNFDPNKTDRSQPTSHWVRKGESSKEEEERERLEKNDNDKEPARSQTAPTTPVTDLDEHRNNDNQDGDKEISTTMSVNFPVQTSEVESEGKGEVEVGENVSRADNKQAIEGLEQDDNFPKKIIREQEQEKKGRGRESSGRENSKDFEDSKDAEGGGGGDQEEGHKAEKDQDRAQDENQNQEKEGKQEQELEQEEYLDKNNKSGYLEAEAVRKKEEENNEESIENSSIDTHDQSSRSTLYKYLQVYERYSDKLLDLLLRMGVKHRGVSDDLISIAKREPMNKKLFIRGLAWTTTEEGLHKAFAQYGEIAHVSISYDKEMQRSRGYGFVTFVNVDDALRATQENEKEIDGRLCFYNLAEVRKNNPNQVIPGTAANENASYLMMNMAMNNSVHLQRQPGLHHQQSSYPLYPTYQYHSNMAHVRSSGGPSHYSGGGGGGAVPLHQQGISYTSHHPMYPNPETATTSISNSNPSYNPSMRGGGGHHHYHHNNHLPYQTENNMEGGSGNNVNSKPWKQRQNHKIYGQNFSSFSTQHQSQHNQDSHQSHPYSQSHQYNHNKNHIGLHSNLHGGGGGGNYISGSGGTGSGNYNNSGNIGPMHGGQTHRNTSHSQHMAPNQYQSHHNNNSSSAMQGTYGNTGGQGGGVGSPHDQGGLHHRDFYHESGQQQSGGNYAYNRERENMTYYQGQGYENMSPSEKGTVAFTGGEGQGQAASGTSIGPNSKKIFVRSLSYDTTRDTLRQVFGQYGKVEEVYVVVDRVSNKSKGYAFVNFRDSEAAQKALEHPSKEIDGRLAICSYASNNSPMYHKLESYTASPRISNQEELGGNLQNKNDVSGYN